MSGALAPHLGPSAGQSLEDGRQVRLALILLAAWLLLQAVLNTMATSSAGLDQAELLVTSQRLNLGDSSQPPLYAWLQHGVFRVFGVSLLSLTVLKHVLLIGAFWFSYQTARIVLGARNKAFTATLALFLFPQIVFETQRTLSHSVLVLCLACAALYMFVRILRDGRLADYALFGLAMGLGLLSKYNFAIVAAALLIAAVIDAPSRGKVLSWRILLALGVAAVVVAPHALWAISNPAVVMSEAATFAFDASASIGERIWTPLSVALVAIVGFGGVPVIIIAAVAFIRPARRTDSPPTRMGRYIITVALVAALVVIGMTVVTGATTLRDRWLFPVLFVLPLALMALWDARLTPGRLRLINLMAIALSVLSATVIFVTTVFPDLVGKPIQGTEPFRSFAATIEQRHGTPSYILANTTNVGGHMRLNFPDTPVSVPVFPLEPSGASDLTNVIAVWKGVGPVPEFIDERLAQLCGTAAATHRAEHLTELYNGSQIESYQLSVISVRDCGAEAVAP